MADEKKKEESKADKFKRLAESRVNKALDALATVRSLANKNNYEFTDEQSAKIMGALEGGLTQVGDAFKGKEEAPSGFSL